MSDDLSRDGSPASPPPAIHAPDPTAAGDGAHRARTREAREREAAWHRGRQPHAEGEHAPTDAELARLAFVALAENVRDYAIFLMDPEGVIRYWGEGAHLLKRWKRHEAEGAHLRLLYPDGGAEDGTAEDHLREAVERGESVSEGHRVRGDGTVFWAHVTLTALRSADGTLLGFAKVTRDVTMRHAAEAAFALTTTAAELDRSRGDRRDLTAELEVLREELEVLREELRTRDLPPDR
jgi:PAS domain S-box-containing protein